MEEVIDIERKEDIVTIEVPEATPADAPVVEMEASIFTKWKRVIVGVSLMMLLVLPIVGGITFSYLNRKEQYVPADLYNIWPDSEYSGPRMIKSATLVDMYKDKGYSFAPNHHVVIRDGEETVFTVKNPDNSSAPPMYMSVYMIENLYGRKEKYGLHVVTKNSPDDLIQYADLNGAMNDSDIRNSGHDLIQNSYMNASRGIYLTNSSSNRPEDDIIAARTLANEMQYNGYYGQRSSSVLTQNVGESDYDYAMRRAADRIKTIAIDQNRGMYKLTSSVSASYTLPDHWDIHLNAEVLSRLQEVRNAKRTEEEVRLERLAEEEEENGEAVEEVPETRSGFRRIIIKPLSE